MYAVDSQLGQRVRHEDGTTFYSVSEMWGIH